MEWTVGPEQSTQDARSGFFGSGFNIRNVHGAPLVTFGYPSEAEARLARDLCR
jgi:hypothetical protein